MRKLQKKIFLVAYTAVEVSTENQHEDVGLKQPELCMMIQCWHLNTTGELWDKAWSGTDWAKRDKSHNQTKGMKIEFIAMEFIGRI